MGEERFLNGESGIPSPLRDLFVMLPFWAEVLLSSTTSCMQMTVEYEYKEAGDEIELAFESSSYIISKLCLPLHFHYYVS